MPGGASEGRSVAAGRGAVDASASYEWRARRGQFQISPEKHDEEWALEQLGRAHDRCRAAGVHTEQLVRTGPPAQVIAEEAARGYLAVFLSERPSLTGAPSLARIIAVPVGPLGLLCINRFLMFGPLCGLISGFGVATADALAAGVAALGISLISEMLSEHQLFLRLVGGVFLCYLGYKIYRTEPSGESPVSHVNGLLGAYATTLFLTFSNPVTILSFVAIYAGWHVPSLHGHYAAAALLSTGVFTGSALWWVGFFIAITTFRGRFNLRFLGWIHRFSGAVIAAFGVIVLLSLSQFMEAIRSGF